MDNQSETISLVGAGLVGSLLAVLLAKKGFKVEIFERRPDMRSNNISAGRSINLALANRGIYPLQQAGLMQEVEPILTPMKGRMVHDVEGKQTFQSYGQKKEEVIYSVSRSELNKICLDAAEKTGRVKIHFNHHCQSVDFAKNQAEFKNQLTGEIQLFSFNRLIGTDGSASAVREAIHQMSSNQHEIIELGHSYKELCIPAGENGEFQIDENSLHIWPRGGYMLIALPNKDSSFTVTLFMPNSGEVSFEQMKSAQDINQFFQQNFADTLPLLPTLAEDFFSNPTGRLATVKCAPWYYQDKALLLGDAAHAVVPFHGQGMNCGFEDALALVDTIARSNESWENIFCQVDNKRKVNGDAIADMAIENYITMRDSVRDPKYLLCNELAFALEKHFPEYFCPRYSMVMFHRLPYAEAKSRGVIQQQILQQLTQDIDNINQVDYSKAEKLIKQQLSKVELNPDSDC